MKLKTTFLSTLLALMAISVHAAEPVELLAQQEPKLYGLLQTYPGQIPALTRYARSQGFVEPIEQVATVVHELIHIDSAAHAGFNVDGTYYEPYLNADAWPAIDNAGVVGKLLPTERGAASERYAMLTQGNRMGNIVDEINAYASVAPFVCKNAPASGQKQVALLKGFLALLNGYLRILRTELPQEYRRLQGNAASRGAVVLVTQRAYAALSACGASQGVMRIERDLLARSNNG